MQNGSKQDSLFLWRFWRLKVWNWCVGPGPFKGSREESFLSSSSIWWLLVILDILWLIDASLHSLLPSLHSLFLCSCVSVSKFPSFYKEAVMVGSGLALINWPPFNLITSTKILFSNIIFTGSYGHEFGGALFKPQYTFPGPHISVVYDKSFYFIYGTLFWYCMPGLEESLPNSLAILKDTQTFFWKVKITVIITTTKITIRLFLQMNTSTECCQNNGIPIRFETPATVLVSED